ncbi:MAG: hypothetical protein ACLSS9_11580 [Acutalibacteraceae bacterium]
MEMPPIERYIEDLGDCTNTRITYYRTYLMQTDYVAAKIAECAYLGQPVEEKYRSILTKREEARHMLNTLETTES